MANDIFTVNEKKRSRKRNIIDLSLVIFIILIVLFWSIFNSSGSYITNRRLFSEQYTGSNGFTRIRAAIMDIESGSGTHWGLNVAELEMVTAYNIRTEIIDVNLRIPTDYGTVRIHSIMHIPELRRIYLGATLPSVNRRSNPHIYSFALRYHGEERQMTLLSQGNSSILRRSFEIIWINNVDIETIHCPTVEFLLYTHGNAVLFNPSY